MTKRNTRVDDADLSEAEQAALDKTLSIRVHPDKPKTLGQAVGVALGELLGNGKPAPKPATKPKPKAKALPPEVIKAREEAAKITRTIERLQSRLFRTVNALQKLERKRRYWQKKAAPVVDTSAV